MTVRNIEKSLAGTEDLAQGIGTAQQKRGTVHRINVFPSSYSYVDMQQYEDGDFFRLYGSDTFYTDYRRNPSGTVGIPAGADGVWEPIQDSSIVCCGSVTYGAYIFSSTCAIGAQDGQMYRWQGSTPETLPAGQTISVQVDSFVQVDDLRNIANRDASGYTLVGNSTLGCTLTASRQLVKVLSTNKEYEWTGTFNKIIAPNDLTVGGDGWVERVNSNALAVDFTYSTLREYSGDLTSVYVSGRANIFDGGQGIFIVDASDTSSSDNDAIVLIDAIGRRWKRQYSGDISPEWFGVSVDAANNYSALMALITYMCATGESCYFKAGRYNYQGTLYADPAKQLVFKGAGKYNTELCKTDNSISGLATSDAFIEFVDRSANSQYVYGVSFDGISLTTAAATKNTYGIRCKNAALWSFNNVRVVGAADCYSFRDSWLMKFSSTTAHQCTRGFVNEATGTSWSMSNVWVEYFSDTAYDITGITYSGCDGMAADHQSNTAAAVYKFTSCQGVSIDGMGAEQFVGTMLQADNSILNINGMRPTKVIVPSATQKIVNAVNNSRVKIGASDFGGLPSSNLFSVENYDATSLTSWEHIKVNSSNSNNPTNGLTRDSVLSTKNGSVYINGFTIADVPINGSSSWGGVSAEVTNTITFIAATRKNGDGHAVFSKQTWALSEISTSSASPTVIGTISNAAGTALTNLRAYRVGGSIAVSLSGPAFTDTMLFITIEA